ncbi:MAG: acyl-CoA dehydrogenase, partial [Alphaproteobacteria bacterium]|nr:acyl-CoA dehydrogenase [Alphaproteobacteria bacterium]
PELAKLGVLGLVGPAEYGGMGQGWTTLALVQERLARHAYFAASICNRVVAFGMMTLLQHGSAAQKAELVPRLIAGKCLIALALSEPEAGSDAGAMRTRAERVAEGWRITGRKTWISDAGGADYLLTPCRTVPGSEGARGVSFLLVPRQTPGIAMTEIAKIGNHCMPSWDIGYDGVIVPDSALIGVEGEGFKHLMSTLHYARASMAAAVTGAAQAAVDIALAHAKERRQFGRPIGANQAIRHMLTDMQTRVDLSRLMAWRLAWAIETGQPCRKEAAQAKLVATETLQYVTDRGMQILASAGYAADSDMARIWRDGRLYSIGEGTNEIQRDLIARELGL